MGQPAIQAQTPDYTKIYWVEAFTNLMDESIQKELPEDKFYFYSRVLVSHTLANNILKDQALADENHVKELIDDFYESYKKLRLINRNALLSTLFMQTLVDIDENLNRLRPIDKEYLTEIGTPSALDSKKVSYLLDDEAKNKWITHYSFAKTPPEVIAGNAQLYQELGKEAYNVYLEQEKYISSGPNILPNDWDDLVIELCSPSAKKAFDFFTKGWYKKYGSSEFSLEDVVSLRNALLNPSEISNVSAKVGYAYFQYRLVQDNLPESARKLYLDTKISNIGTFIEHGIKTQLIAANLKRES